MTNTGSEKQKKAASKAKFKKNVWEFVKLYCTVGNILTMRRYFVIELL